MSQSRSNIKATAFLAGIAVVLSAGAAYAQALNRELRSDAPPVSIRDLAPDTLTAWVPDRPTGDDYLPPPSGPGPVMSVKDRPYVPNGTGAQPTYRVADLNNPILQDWVKVPMKKANDDVLAGKVPYITRERCWPAGVPGFTVYTRVQAIHFFHSKDKITIANELYAHVRHIYMDVPHSANPGKTWFGESVGHYEGDELVVDTIGLNDRTFVDNYRTPHTDKIHVVERFKLLDGGKVLQATVTVDDPGAFTTPWTGIQRWQRIDRPLVENLCEETNTGFLGYDVVPIPTANKADF